MMTDDAKKATSVSTSEIDANPAINRFVLYAERSIKLGSYSQALDGNVGVRSAIAPAAEQKQAGSAAQLILGKHGKCCDIFAPSTSLEIYSEVGDVFTDALTRAEDIGIGKEHEFPAAMPALPLAMALGHGADITVERSQRMSLTPGTYGAITLFYNSELWLASGKYVFASLRMDEEAKLLADPGEVDLGIVGSLWTDKRARIAPHEERAKASDFNISVAGSDGAVKNSNGEPLYLGSDTHALSEPAQVSALEVLAANGVRVLVDARGGYTPTPAVSRAILAHNAGGSGPRADGIVVTPSHNPPPDGGFKYNPPDGGPPAPTSPGTSRTGPTNCSPTG